MDLQRPEKMLMGIKYPRQHKDKSRAISDLLDGLIVLPIISSCGQLCRQKDHDTILAFEAKGLMCFHAAIDLIEQHL